MCICLLLEKFQSYWQVNLLLNCVVLCGYVMHFETQTHLMWEVPLIVLLSGERLLMSHSEKVGKFYVYQIFFTACDHLWSSWEIVILWCVCLCDWDVIDLNQTPVSVFVLSASLVTSCQSLVSNPRLNHQSCHMIQCFVGSSVCVTTARLCDKDRKTKDKHKYFKIATWKIKMISVTVHILDECSIFTHTRSHSRTSEGPPTPSATHTLTHLQRPAAHLPQKPVSLFQLIFTIRGWAAIVGISSS